MKIVSKSVRITLLFDLLVLVFSSIFWYKLLNLQPKFLWVSVILIAITGIITLALKSNYIIREFNNTKKNIYLLFEGIVFTHIPLILFFFIFYRDINTFKFILFNFLSIFVLLKLYRMIFHYYLFNIKKHENVLILGVDENAKLIANEIINKKALMMNISGFLADSEISCIDANKFNVYPEGSNISNILKENKIDIIIVAISNRMKESFLTEIVAALPKNVKLYKMAHFYEFITGKYFVNKMSINWLFYEYMNRRSILYDILKRTYDIIAAIIIGTVTFPILLYIGIRVKLTDGGSPIYTQKRVGRNGKTFKMYKLRTMYLNDYVPKQGKIEHTEGQDNDDRVIPFCKFVRKARFDEIPQMINILKGEMSIVGPRTEWEDLVKIYTNEVPYYACRQWVKTGWTGWAQINQGHCVSSDDIAEKLQYDLYYLKHRNIIWEIGILIKAVFLALGGRHG